MMAGFWGCHTRSRFIYIYRTGTAVQGLNSQIAWNARSPITNHHHHHHHHHFLNSTRNFRYINNQLPTYQLQRFAKDLDGRCHSCRSLWTSQAFCTRGQGETEGRDWNVLECIAILWSSTGLDDDFYIIVYNIIMYIYIYLSLHRHLYNHIVTLLGYVSQ